MKKNKFLVTLGAMTIASVAIIVTSTISCANPTNPGNENLKKFENVVTSFENKSFAVKTTEQNTTSQDFVKKLNGEAAKSKDKLLTYLNIPTDLISLLNETKIDNYNASIIKDDDTKVKVNLTLSFDGITTAKEIIITITGLNNNKIARIAKAKTAYDAATLEVNAAVKNEAEVKIELNTAVENKKSAEAILLAKTKTNTELEKKMQLAIDEKIRAKKAEEQAIANINEANSLKNIAEGEKSQAENEKETETKKKSQAEESIKAAEDNLIELTKITSLESAKSNLSLATVEETKAKKSVSDAVKNLAEIENEFNEVKQRKEAASSYLENIRKLNNDATNAAVKASNELDRLIKVLYILTKEKSEAEEAKSEELTNINKKFDEATLAKNNAEKKATATRDKKVAIQNQELSAIAAKESADQSGSNITVRYNNNQELKNQADTKLLAATSAKESAQGIVEDIMSAQTLVDDRKTTLYLVIKTAEDLIKNAENRIRKAVADIETAKVTKTKAETYLAESTKQKEAAVSTEMIIKKEFDLAKNELNNAKVKVINTTNLETSAKTKLATATSTKVAKEAIQKQAKLTLDNLVN